jgi:aspartate aminotransferase-like enzyme
VLPALPSADPPLPVRLLAGGGPSTPDPRVLRALTTPLIGQFDPAFTAIMDDVAQLARQTFLTASPHCFGISALASGGLEAVLNTFDTPDVHPVVVPFGLTTPSLKELADECHRQGSLLVVDATFGLGARELRVDDWDIDVCVAGVEYAIGAPAGMSLVTYSTRADQALQRRATPPTTSYLDLVQLQAYWSPERLNHHTAPTSLVYGLREALRLVHAEGLEAVWQRHAAVGARLREGLESLGLTCDGELPYSIVQLPAAIDEARARDELLAKFGVHVARVAPRSWRLGLLGADARPESAERVLAALERALHA